MGGHQSVNKLYSAMMEALPSRVLLSVSLEGHTLKIVGTESADQIALSADPHLINILDVQANEQTEYFSLSAIGRVEIQTLGGDDNILIDSSLESLPFRTKVDGGNGNDTIDTGSGPDIIIGGAGDDSLMGGRGGDWIDGDSGNDSIGGCLGS